LCGAGLAALALCGVVYGARAALAQAIYHQAKYGIARNNPAGILRRCREAHRLYPYNYRFCVWAAEQAYDNRLETDGRESLDRIEAASLWCDRGLALNPYQTSLRLLRTRLLGRQSATAAVAYWREYTDWHFWEPYNHAFLVELYARAGDYGAAIDELAWVKGSEYEQQARRALRDSWKAEADATVPGGPGRVVPARAPKDGKR
jgi:hypothetical protein